MKSETLLVSVETNSGRKKMEEEKMNVENTLNQYKRREYCSNLSNEVDLVGFSPSVAHLVTVYLPLDQRQR